MELFIWNNKTSTFEELTDKSKIFTENISHYFDQKGEILIQIKFGPDQTGEPTRLPTVEIKGVANK